MPIEVDSEIRIFKQDEFHALAHRVMGVVFGVHNEFGRGTHEMCLIAEDTARALTAIKDGKAQMKDHLQRCLAHIKLTCIQWINLDNHNIEFQTIKRRMAE